jgi:hypothetical protein
VVAPHSFPRKCVFFGLTRVNLLNINLNCTQYMHWTISIIRELRGIRTGVHDVFTGNKPSLVKRFLKSLPNEVSMAPPLWHYTINDLDQA